jgi:hypothetical protein
MPAKAGIHCSNVGSVEGCPGLRRGDFPFRGCERTSPPRLSRPTAAWGRVQRAAVRAAFLRKPLHDRNIFQSNMPGPLAADRTAVLGTRRPPKNLFSFSINGVKALPLAAAAASRDTRPDTGSNTPRRRRLADDVMICVARRTGMAPLRARRVPRQSGGDRKP